jgi:hypothetical protein
MLLVPPYLSLLKLADKIPDCRQGYGRSGRYDQGIVLIKNKSTETVLNGPKQALDAPKHLLDGQKHLLDAQKHVLDAPKYVLDGQKYVLDAPKHVLFR